jgi:hypothetical protein
MIAPRQRPGDGLGPESGHPGARQRHTDQDRTLLTMQQLEEALGAAAPRREHAWLGDVRHAVTVLGEAVRDEAGNAGQPDSLLSDIARTQPWLRNRVRALRIHHRQLTDTLTALRHELDGTTGENVDFTDIRQRLAWVLAGLRHQRARESDLIYEAYYDAFRTDLPAEASGPDTRLRTPGAS